LINAKAESAGLSELATTFTRTSAEVAWKEFIEWIGFSTLLDALDRKHRSLEDWRAFREVAPRLFSIEYGLKSALQKWRSTRKLWYPKQKEIYDAYSFVAACVQIRRQLSEDQSRVFRRRVISEILPSGRLCHLDHEFRTAQNLIGFGWRITRFGFCGDPGPDFVARRGPLEIEVESKCLSPEIGLGASYEFAARLMSRFSRELRSRNPLCLTTIRIELREQTEQAGGMDAIKRRVLECYERTNGFDSESISISIEVSSLDEFLNRFPGVHDEEWLQTTFRAIRTRKGDYGYFIRRDEELIFCNLVPLRPNQQAKKIMKLISATCERQFSKERPALLWLHLQGLAPHQIDGDPDWAAEYVERFARYAFLSERRSHVSSLVFTSDSELDHHTVYYQGRDRRKLSAVGHVKGFDNKRCRFGPIHILAPLFSTSA
jgi:hypothetical protein